MKTIEDLFITHHARSDAFCDYELGKTAYLTNGLTNNGVVGHVTPKPTDKVFNFRALVVSAFCEATVQLPPFIAYGAAGTSLTVLEPRSPMTAGELAHIAAYINSAHRWRFNWYRRSIGARLRTLPIPDGASVKASFPVEELLPSAACQDRPSWEALLKPVVLEDLFDLAPGNYHSLAELSPGKTPVISCSDKGNGIAGYFDVGEHLYENKLTVALNGSPLTTKYHAYKFAAKDDVAVCLPKQPLCLSTLLFVQMALNLERWRYSYYRKCYVGKLQRFRIQLPMIGAEVDEETIAGLVRSAPYWDYLSQCLEATA